MGKLKCVGWFRRSALFRSARGVTLLEVLIAVVVLALISASVPTALLAITNNQYRWNEQRTAESLTRNVIEYIKVTDYVEGASSYDVSNLPLPSDMWEITADAQPIDPATGDPVTVDQRVQEITITVNHVDRQVLVTKDYKVDRLEFWQQ